MILTNRTKYRFCLTTHLDNEATSTDDTVDTTFLGIVHIVVESTTFYGAATKGGVAAKFLTSTEAVPAVNDYTPIYDFDETPASQLADRRSSLPAVIQVTSAEGAQLFAATHVQTRDILECPNEIGLDCSKVEGESKKIRKKGALYENFSGYLRTT